MISLYPGLWLIEFPLVVFLELTQEWKKQDGLLFPVFLECFRACMVTDILFFFESDWWNSMRRPYNVVAPIKGLCGILWCGAHCLWQIWPCMGEMNTPWYGRTMGDACWSVVEVMQSCNHGASLAHDFRWHCPHLLWNLQPLSCTCHQTLRQRFHRCNTNWHYTLRIFPCLLGFNLHASTWRKVAWSCAQSHSCFWCRHQHHMKYLNAPHEKCEFTGWKAWKVLMILCRP
jgi:hypothetical protein